MTSTETDRLKDLRTALEAKRDFVKEGLEKGVKIEGSNIQVKSDDYAALQGAMKDIEEIKRKHRQLLQSRC